MIRAEELLREHGAVLLRQRKHKVYGLPDGRKVVLSASPSDGVCGAKNAEMVVRRELGLTDPNRGAPGKRRERSSAGPPVRSAPARFDAKVQVRDWKSAWKGLTLQGWSK